VRRPWVALMLSPLIFVGALALIPSVGSHPAATATKSPPTAAASKSHTSRAAPSVAAPPVTPSTAVASASPSTVPSGTTSTVPTTTTTLGTVPVASPAPVTATGSGDTVTPEERAAWSLVNQCEESGNWHVQGSVYQGGLGISVVNWAAFGGLASFGPEWAASPDEQIMVAERIQHDPPDQHGCSGGW
jgi:Transglycosylase-like domain